MQADIEQILSLIAGSYNTAFHRFSIKNEPILEQKKPKTIILTVKRKRAKRSDFYAGGY